MKTRGAFDIKRVFRRQPGPLGIVLPLSLITLLMLMLLTTANLSLVTNTYVMVEHNVQNYQRQLDAESMENIGEGYLAILSQPASTIYYPSSSTYYTLPNGYTGQVKIMPYSDQNNAWLLSYVLQGNVIVNSNVVQTVQTELTAVNFSLYGYCEDTGLSNNWWVGGISQFSGPFHSNGNYNTSTHTASYPSQISWTRGGQNQMIFNGLFSSCASTITWSGSGAPKSSADWSTIFSGGQASVTLNAPYISYPSSSVIQQGAAAGIGVVNGALTSAAPSTAGVTTNATINNAGIYICTGGYSSSNVSIVFSTYTSPTTHLVVPTTQVITVTSQVQVSSKWTNETNVYTIDNAANTTAVTTTVGTNQPTTANYSGVPNGNIYCDGNINSIQGVITNNYVSGGIIVQRNSWNVVTNFASSSRSTAYITNNLDYYQEPNPALGATDPYNLTPGALGLSAYQIRVKSGIVPDSNYDHGNSNYTPHPNHQANDLVLNGSFFGTESGSSTSQASFYCEDYAKTPILGTLSIMGGTIVRNATVTGTFSGSSLVSGFGESYSYDPRLASKGGPLVNFPTTNQYKLESWQLL